MQIKWTRSSLSKVVVLILAIIIGAPLGAIALPAPWIDHLQALAGRAWIDSIMLVLLSTFVLLGLTLLEKDAVRQMQLDQELLRAFLEHIPHSVYFKDLKSRFIRVSQFMADSRGLGRPEKAVRKTDADIYSREHAEKARTDEQEIIRTGRAMVNVEERETWPDGRQTWSLTTKVPLKNGRGKIIGTMGVSRDITDRKASEFQIQHMAMHDALTGLPNRTLLDDRLVQAIGSAKRDGETVAVFLLDLDRYKNINDSLGHATGDRLLQTVASRLKACTREGNTAARFCGDEFVLICSGVADKDAAAQIAKSVLHSVAEPIEVGDRELQLTASIGIALFPENGTQADDLLQYADIAMHEAKKKGRSRYSFFTPDLTEVTKKHSELESDLANAHARGEFLLYYQPVVASTGRIVGMEALLRWKHPKHGLISPDQFIPELEEMGLMVEVGEWVLRMACRQAREWNLQSSSPIRIAANVSSQQFYEGNLVSVVESALREENLDAKYLELELTEGRMLDASEATISIMQRLKQLGVSIALDDFGTGYSSLSYLRRFPLDRIKIDRSFVRDVVTHPGAAAMVKGILSIANVLGFSTVAEGIETVRQRDTLIEFGCPEMQGYYFSRPVTAVEATALLRSADLEESRVAADQRTRKPVVAEPLRRRQAWG